jgi:hypothetical protein
LLPGFDEYLLGYTDRSHVLAKVHNASVIHSNGIFKPTVVVEGQIVGAWGRKAAKGKMLVTPTIFAPLSQNERRVLAVAAGRYGEFLGLPVEIHWE